MMDVARPTMGAERPRPEENANADLKDEEVVDWEERGVDRNNVQRLLKAPIWKSKKATVRRVKRTFLVKIR